MFCGSSDDPFYVDLGAIFDLANLRANCGARDGLARYNVHSIALSIPVSTLQKDSKTAAQAANILDSGYVIGVWASASRPAMHTLNGLAGNGTTTATGTYTQVSRLGMLLLNEAINLTGAKDAWDRTTLYNEAAVTDDYLSNPELALYMADDVPMNGAAPKASGAPTYYGQAIPNLAARRIQSKSLGALDFHNGAAGLSGLTTAQRANTVFADPTFGPYLLVAGKPRSVDSKPSFHTGVPNLPPYQLATGKAGNPLAAGKPFANTFLPVIGDMLRLNMAVPATPRNSPDFSNEGLLAAAVLGLSDPAYNGSATLQFIPNMEGFPNGRRLKDAVDQIELKTVSGVVLAAIGLWYDDYVTGASPVPAQLGNVLGYTTGVERSDTTIRAAFPFVQTPWSRTGSASGPTNTLTFPDMLVSTAMPVESGTYNNIIIASGEVAAFNGPIVVNGALTVQAGGVLSTQGQLATNCVAITGPGSFTLAAGATLHICDASGISATGGTTGSIQLTGARSYSSDASYECIGGDAQTSGTGLPSRVRSLTVNGGGLTLNNGGVAVAP